MRSFILWLRVTVVLIAFITSLAFADPPKAKFTVLGPVNAYHLSEDGTTVVGDTQTSPVRAFQWTANSGIVQLPAPEPQNHAFGVGVSGDGATVSLQNGSPYLWTASGGVQPANVPDTFYSGQLSADARFIVGDIGQQPTLVDTETSNASVAYLSTGKSLGIGYSVSTDGDYMVGVLSKRYASSIADAEYEAFRWDAVSGTIGLGDLPGGAFHSLAFDVSADGAVVVGNSVSQLSAAGSATSLNMEAFRWTAETGMVGLGDLPGGIFSSEAHAISMDGSIIVGGGNPKPGLSGAFIYDTAHGMRNLGQLMAGKYGLAEELAGWQLSVATDISADGRTIIGMGMDPQDHYSAWIAHVPEPSSYALVTIGLIGLAGVIRQRMRQ